MGWFKKIREDKEQALKAHSEKISKNKEIVEKIIEKYFKTKDNNLILGPVKQYAYEKNKKYKIYNVLVRYSFNTNLVLLISNNASVLYQGVIDIEDLPADSDYFIKRIKDFLNITDDMWFDPFKDTCIKGKKILSIDNDIVTVEE